MHDACEKRSKKVLKKFLDKCRLIEVFESKLEVFYGCIHGMQRRFRVLLMKYGFRQKSLMTFFNREKMFAIDHFTKKLATGPGVHRNAMNTLQKKLPLVSEDMMKIMVRKLILIK